MCLVGIVGLATAWLLRLLLHSTVAGVVIYYFDNLFEGSDFGV